MEHDQVGFKSRLSQVSAETTLQRRPAAAGELQSRCPFSPSFFTLFPCIDFHFYYFYWYSLIQQKDRLDLHSTVYYWYTSFFTNIYKCPMILLTNMKNNNKFTWNLLNWTIMINFLLIIVYFFLNGAKHSWLTFINVL